MDYKDLICIKKGNKNLNLKERLLFKGFTINGEQDFCWINKGRYFNFNTLIENIEKNKNHITDKKIFEDFLYDYGFYDLGLDNEDLFKNEFWNYLNKEKGGE